MKQASSRKARTYGGLVLLLCATGLAASGLRIKKLKANANPPQYVRFSERLSGQQIYQHALNRLTFGPRPGDLAQLEQVGLKKWLDEQLHPERVAENPLLAPCLAQLASLEMSIHETYASYPSPQVIRAFARGRGKLPADPELQKVVVHLADRYLARQTAKNGTASTSAPNGAIAGDQGEETGGDLKMKLAAILTPEQMQVLNSGKPLQKRQLLEEIPEQEQLDFAWALTPPERRKLFVLAPVELRRKLMLTVNPQNVVASDLSEGKILRAVYSNHQFVELLDDFWFNHFNVFLYKGGDRYLVPTYERAAIRPHVLGKFHDLLLATAESPAMLFYLDNWQSVGVEQASRAPGARKTERGLNENYGRELMELQTLGVDGGYTQKDVVEVARCFTGWTIANPRKGGGFEYNDKLHDKGQKVVLGHVIKAGGGMNDGLEVIDILSHHPATAHFISLKLAERFVADDPPPSLVDRMAKTFLKTDGDLRQVMQTMLTSPEFWSQGAYHAKVKTPFEMVVSAARATNADVTSAFLLANELQKLGEPLYRKIEPTGYSSANAEWVSSAALLERMNFALALAHNRVPGVNIDTAAWRQEAEQDPMLLARSILQQNPSPQTQSAIEKTLSSDQLQQQLSKNARTGAPQLPSLVAGLALGSPEFQKR